MAWIQLKIKQFVNRSWNVCSYALKLHSVINVIVQQYLNEINE